MQNISSNIQDNLSNFHMAGIIPVFGSDIGGDGLPWDKSLTQIGENLLAAERAVLECNFAGCETIWIVCNEDTQPLVRHRIGDYVTCFESIVRSKYSKYPQTKIENIPIFYVPVPSLSRGKRDSLAWSILHGANEAFVVSAKISKWITPNKYYVAFPYGIYDPKLVTSGKKAFFSKKNVMLKFGKKTVGDNLYAGFTFRPSDFKKIRRKIKENCSGLTISETSGQKWSSRYFTLDKFYNCGNIEDVEFIEIEKYHSCESWHALGAYFKSELFSVMTDYNLQKINGKLRKKVESGVV